MIFVCDYNMEIKWDSPLNFKELELEGGIRRERDESNSIQSEIWMQKIFESQKSECSKVFRIVRLIDTFLQLIERFTFSNCGQLYEYWSQFEFLQKFFKF